MHHVPHAGATDHVARRNLVYTIYVTYTYSPINEYDLDLADLTASFEPCPRYENKDGAHCNVGVYCGGAEPNKSNLKTVEMAFEEGRWKARVFNGVFTAVVKPFYGGTADEAELAREDAYRAGFNLQTRESIALEERIAKQNALAAKDTYQGRQTHSCTRPSAVIFLRRPPTGGPCFGLWQYVLAVAICPGCGNILCPLPVN